MLPGSASDAFIHAAAGFLADLNAIHPFREGNGRAQLSFLYLVALRAAHPLHLEQIERETFLPAMIASYDGHLEPLITALSAIRA